MSNKIILTVDSQYVDWGIDQGIRELMQNGIDAQAKGHALSVYYNATQQTLTISNTGITIPKSSLLIGYSTKKGDNSQIGEFGEGYKLGCMALVKRGLSVRINTRNEQWQPMLEWSDAFEREVLAFEINTSDKSGEFVEFIVSGLTEDQWNDARRQFLMFDDKRKYTAWDVSDGQQVLSGPNYKGRIYVNGILIQQITDEQYHYGYNFKPGTVKVDRDRRMTERNDLKHATSTTIHTLASDNPDFFDSFETMMKAGAPDVHHLYDITPSLLGRLYQSFSSKYGDGAIPASNEQEVTEAGHYGRRGKVFSPRYVSALSEFHDLSLYHVRHSFGTRVLETYNLLALPKTEQRNLLKAQEAVAVAVPQLLSVFQIQVGRFVKNTSVQGLFYDDNNRVVLNRSILKDYKKTLATLVHEVAHAEGGDGSKEHLDEMTRIWVTIATTPKRKKSPVVNE